MLTSLPVTLYPSKRKSAWLLLLMLVFVVLGCMLVWLELDVLWGWINIGFFGFGASVMALQFHPRASYLTLDEQGFTLGAMFRTWRTSWGDVAEFGVYRIAHNDIAGWNYRDDYPQRNRAHAIAKGMWGFEASLPETYGLKAPELAALLNNLRTLLLKEQI